jgi:hypothetical protein
MKNERLGKQLINSVRFGFSTFFSTISENSTNLDFQPNLKFGYFSNNNNKCMTSSTQNFITF